MSLEHARQVASAAKGVEVEWGAYEWEQALEEVRNLRERLRKANERARFFEHEMAMLGDSIVNPEESR